MGFMDQPLEGFRCIAFGKDPNSSVLFVKDSHLWWKLWSAKQMDFLDNPVTTDLDGFRGDDADPHGPIIFCLGDSTMFGGAWRSAKRAPANLRRCSTMRSLVGRLIDGSQRRRWVKWFHESVTVSGGEYA